MKPTEAQIEELHDVIRKVGEGISYSIYVGDTMPHGVDADIYIVFASSAVETTTVCAIDKAGYGGTVVIHKDNPTFGYGYWVAMNIWL